MAGQVCESRSILPSSHRHALNKLYLSVERQQSHSKTRFISGTITNLQTAPSYPVTFRPHERTYAHKHQYCNSVLMMFTSQSNTIIHLSGRHDTQDSHAKAITHMPSKSLFTFRITNEKLTFAWLTIEELNTSHEFQTELYLTSLYRLAIVGITCRLIERL